MGNRQGRQDVVITANAPYSNEKSLKQGTRYLGAGKRDKVAKGKDAEVPDWINELDERGQAPLHRAIEGASSKRVRELLALGADVNLKDSSGHTALHNACRFQAVPIIRILTEGGADLDILTPGGETALHIAVRQCNLSTVNILLIGGADMKVKNKDGYNPFGMTLNYLFSVKEIYCNMNLILRAMAAYAPTNVISTGESEFFAARMIWVYFKLEYHDTSTQKAMLKMIFDLLERGFRIDLLIQGKSLLHHTLTKADNPLNIYLFVALIRAGALPEEFPTALLERLWGRTHQVCYLLYDLCFYCPAFYGRMKELPSLQAHCRRQIRTTLVKNINNEHLVKKVNSLPLPDKLKDYLSLSNIPWLMEIEQISTVVVTELNPLLCGTPKN